MTREEAIDIIKCLAWHTRPDEEDLEQAIKALDQKPKTGHWEHIKDKFGGHRIRCSCCQYTEAEYITFSRNYCPNCGARMVESEEQNT